MFQGANKQVLKKGQNFMITKLMCLLAVFVAGVIFSANLTRLLYFNTNYEPAWYKVGISIGSAIWFGSCLIKKER